MGFKTNFRKVSVDSIGYFDFVFIRYFFCGVIALFVLIFNYLSGKKMFVLEDSKLTFNQTIGMGLAVCVVAMLAALANYKLLETYDASFVTL